MTIAFIHSFQSFLPEIHAYEAFFRKRGIQTMVISTDEWKSRNSMPDVEWLFMGFDRQPITSAIRIHEYTSASTPPLSAVKDGIKRIMNVKPHYRIFLNNYIRNKLDFPDTIPFGYRDMGIVPFKGERTQTAKEFDFIYIGSTAPARRLHRLIDLFTTSAMSEYRLLILSSDNNWLQKKYKHYSNILFRGPANPEEVNSYLLRSGYGINYIPDEEPFNQQTSTKLLEYMNAGLPVISTRYTWMEIFIRKFGGKVFYIDAQNPVLNMNELQEFTFASADLREWLWEKKIEECGILAFLQQQFPDLTI